MRDGDVIKLLEHQALHYREGPDIGRRYDWSNPGGLGGSHPMKKHGSALISRKRYAGGMTPNDTMEVLVARMQRPEHREAVEAIATLSLEEILAEPKIKAPVPPSSAVKHASESSRPGPASTPRHRAR